MLHVRQALAIGVAFLAGSAAAKTIDEFPTPTPSSFPYDIVVGPDGNLWFAESIGHNVARLTTAGVITEFPIPGPNSYPHGLTVGPDGNLWFTEVDANEIGKITTTGVVTEFVLPNAGSLPVDITSGPDGNLWFTEADGNRIGRITTSGAITEFVLPTAGSYPLHITAGPDGNLWFLETHGNRIGRMTTAGVLSEYAIPTAGSVLSGIVSGPDGNLWFTEGGAAKIGRITPAGVVTEFPLVASRGPAGITVGPDGALWFGEQDSLIVEPDRIGRITTAGVITEYAVPTDDADPSALVTGPDGNIWFTEYRGSKVGRLITAPVKGDFDGDGQSELIFRNAIDGVRNRVWFMNGVARASQDLIVPNAPSADWLIRGADDFDSASAPGTGRDFLTDLVFWNRVTGSVEFWLMNGVDRVGSSVPLSGATALPPNWDLSATAEFNHDGKPDVVWRDFITQQIVIWTMNGVTKTGAIVPNPSQAVDVNWIVVAAADYNDDGQTDFLWYNYTSGKIVTWYMDANVVRTAGQFTTPDAAADANWKVVASADYSGASGVGTPPASSPDVVWRNETSGSQVVWHMDFASTRVTGEFTVPISNSPSLNWTIAGPR